ncbi:DNA polymerase III subunit gamma/tau [Campylobacter concisus]|uniref:DNA polymerase III subunit gamma/tau n=1 Tax=Campylobacter concisus TaxID=199 RepID=UPI000CD99365|nr:DNA polymerase III subunit gamma/tau [Campylobacter concisus]QPH87974.1 DNA polymerase III subunit gamma/tau [Campylobacter concisus]QPI02922.1 DNA polymerase III subunit gamma/tau [Campylobacter concisus]
MQALALKYRPKNFDELIGQEAVSKSLIHALDEGRISHAYLFSGLRGSGKTSSARIFSKALVCEKGPTSKPCEVCPQCIMANESRHMDIIEMDAASHRKIDDIRELIEQTKYAPAMARYKIFIIDEVHMLTKEAFNALLKTLEEPPSYVKFILATTDPLKLPTTVLSRTQHFRFKQISRYSIIKHLEFILSKEGISYEKEALEILARSGGGSLRDTLTLLDQAIIYGANNVTANGVASMLGLLDPEKIEEIIAHVLNHDKNAIRVLVSKLESYDPEMIIDEILANLKQKFLENDSKISLLVYERFFRILAQAKGMLNISSDNGFVLMLMLFMMIEALNLQDIDDAINEVISKNSENSTQITEVITQKSQAAPAKMQGPYELFLTKIYDRNYDLGEFFKEFVEFSFFNNNELGLIVNAKDENLKYFKKNWKILNEILHTLFGQNAKIVNAKSDEQKAQTKTPKASLENNEKSELDELDEEISRLNANNIETKNEPKTEIKTELQNEKNNFALMLNKEPKTPEELQRQREQGVLKEANRLFGEPTIES